MSATYLTCVRQLITVRALHLSCSPLPPAIVAALPPPSHPSVPSRPLSCPSTHIPSLCSPTLAGLGDAVSPVCQEPGMTRYTPSCSSVAAILYFVSDHSLCVYVKLQEVVNRYPGLSFSRECEGGGRTGKRGCCTDGLTTAARLLAAARWCAPVAGHWLPNPGRAFCGAPHRLSEPPSSLPLPRFCSLTAASQPRYPIWTVRWSGTSRYLPS